MIQPDPTDDLGAMFGIEPAAAAGVPLPTVNRAPYQATRGPSPETQALAAEARAAGATTGHGAPGQGLPEPGFENYTGIEDPEFTAQAQAIQAEQQAQPERELQQKATNAQEAMALARKHGVSVQEAFAMMGEQVRAPSAPNPMRPIAEEFAGTTAEARGREGDAMTYGAVAENERNAQLAAMADDQAMQNTMQLTVDEAQQRERAELEHEKFSALEESNRAVMESAQALREAPDVDPGRLWASRSAGQKAMFVIGGLLGNLTLGLTDPAFGEFSNLRRAVQDDIDAQKYNREQDFDEFGAQVNAQDASMSVYGKLLAHHGDERLADESMRLARWDAMKQNYLAKAAELGVPIESAAIQKQLSQFDQESAGIKKNLDTLVATTSKRVGGGLRNRYNKQQQALIMAGAKADIKAEADLEQTAVTEQGKNVREVAKIEGAQAARGKLTEKDHAAQAVDLANQTKKIDTTIGQIDDILDDYKRTGDLPGYGSRTPYGIGQGHTIGDDASSFQLKLGMIKEGSLVNLTGVSSEDEQKELFGGLTTGKSETDVIKHLEMLKRMHEVEKQAVYAGYTDEAIQQVTKTQGVPTRGAYVSGAAGRSDRPEGVGGGVVSED